MRFRKLRIAWSIFWGVMCLALVVACFVVQYRGASVELMRRNGPGATAVEIYKGNLSLSWVPRASRAGWAGQINRYGFRYNVYTGGSGYAWAPIGFVGAMLAAAIAPLAALPWIRSRFSLRTVLIVTTLVAVVLGVMVYAVGS